MSELLRLTGVTKRYRRGSQELCVLRDADLELHAGEVVSVLGMRGGGKTTLLRIAAGMESADAGIVRFAGRDLTRLSDGELSRLLGGQIAWAGKSGPGMPMRMLDYVAMPLLVGKGRKRRGGRKTVYTQAQVALDRVGAIGCAEQHWQDLSDWERALVEIGQAIAGEPELMLVDDLTDALGVRETDELTGLLRSLSRESRLGILMTVSDAQATLWSDRILTLSGGGTLTQGPRSPSGNVIEFPDLGMPRRDVERGSMR